jgi:hypothetical protein
MATCMVGGPFSVLMLVSSAELSARTYYYRLLKMRSI